MAWWNREYVKEQFTEDQARNEFAEQEANAKDLANADEIQKRYIFGTKKTE